MRNPLCGARNNLTGVRITDLESHDLFDAMKTLLVLFIALLPLQAQEIQLTLNCQIERAHDFKTRQAGPSSGSFSAIVHMSNSQDATIKVTKFQLRGLIQRTGGDWRV